MFFCYIVSLRPCHHCRLFIRFLVMAFQSPLLADHPIAYTDPPLARRLDFALTNYITIRTRKCYSSGVNSYVTFCSLEQVHPFPVDPLWLCAWIIHSAMYVSVPSIFVYLAAIKYAQGSRGMVWSLSGNEQIRRVVAFVKRKYGCQSASGKLAISLDMIAKMATFLPGWPSPELMSHDDRLFVAVSVIAVLCFLRGGEFLYSPNSPRRPLLARDVNIVFRDSLKFVSVSISNPKQRWWIPLERARCFGDPAFPHLDPARLVEDYRSRSVIPLPLAGPAFCTEDGSIMSKTWFLDRTLTLLRRAGVLEDQVDNLGSVLSLKAASWRAGGVRTAKRAGVPDSIIMVLGRWTSSAWLRYFSASSSDIRSAVTAMWQSSVSDPRLQVGVVFPRVEAFSDAVGEVSSEVDLYRSGLVHRGNPAAHLSSPHRRCLN
jgi:hypothetical protein